MFSAVLDDLATETSHAAAVVQPACGADALLGIALAACGSRQTVQQVDDDATPDDGAELTPQRDGGAGTDLLAPSIGDGRSAVRDTHAGDGGGAREDAGAGRDAIWWPFDLGGGDSWPFDLGGGDSGPVADGSADGAAPDDSGGGDSIGVAPPGQSCATAQPLLLAGGKVSVAADTSGAANEFGTAIDCGSYTSSASPSNFVAAGGQHYYKAAVKPGQSYKVTLSPQYWGALLYAFTGCEPAQINADCGSGGKTGDVASNLTKGVAPRIRGPTC